MLFWTVILFLCDGITVLPLIPLVILNYFYHNLSKMYWLALNSAIAVRCDEKTQWTILSLHIWHTDATKNGWSIPRIQPCKSTFWLEETRTQLPPCKICENKKKKYKVNCSLWMCKFPNLSSKKMKKAEIYIARERLKNILSGGWTWTVDLQWKKRADEIKVCSSHPPPTSKKYFPRTQKISEFGCVILYDTFFINSTFYIS